MISIKPICIIYDNIIWKDNDEWTYYEAFTVNLFDQLPWNSVSKGTLYRLQNIICASIFLIHFNYFNKETIFLFQYGDHSCLMVSNYTV